METLLLILFCVAVVGGLLFIFKFTELSRSLKVLEVDVRDLRRRIGELSSPSPAPDAAAKPASAAEHLTREMLAIEDQVAMERHTPASPPPASPRPGPEPARSSFGPPGEQPPGPSRTREEWEQLIGGKFLNRIGALALIIGVGFFLKYAFDNNWLSETVRVLIGAAAGLALLGGAAYFRKKGLAIFAQGLVGAGIAILYISAYASFNFYHLVAQPTAFVLMAAVTVIAFTQAFAYDSLAVSLLGWAGGFLTPFLLSTGEANETGLFTYIALLDAGLLVVILRKQAWQLLHPLTAGATYLIYTLWFEDAYQPGMVGLTVFFIALLWALFLALDLLNRPRPAPAARMLHEFLGVANALFLYVAVLAALHEQHGALNGTAIACMALLYGIATLAATRSAPGDRVRFTRLLLTAIALVSLAIEAEYQDYTVILLWALEAAAVLWSSLRWKLKALTIAAVALYGITAVAILANPNTYIIDPGEFRLLLNSRCAGLALYALSLALAPAALRNISAGWQRAADIFRWGWAAVLFLLLTGEVNDLFRQWHGGTAGGEANAILAFHHFLALAGIWTLTGLVLGVLGSRRALSAVRNAGGAMLLMAITLLGTIAFSWTLPAGLLAFLNVRVLMFLVTIGAALFFARSLPFAPLLRAVWLEAALFLMLLLLTAETRDVFARLIAGVNRDGGGAVARELSRLENLKQLSLSAVWLLFAAGLMAAGLVYRSRPLRFTAIGLLGFTILKIFLYDLSFLETLYRIYSFIGLGIILLAASYAYQRNKELILGHVGEKTPAA